MRLLYAIIISLTVAQPSSAWLVEYLATETVLDLLSGGKTTSVTPVVTTAPLTVTPTSTSTDFGTDYVTETGFDLARINITTKYLVLPNGTDLPVSPFYAFAPPTATNTASPTIITHYYIPNTISNPETCTKTSFTYTDSIQVQLPDSLTQQATESSLATFVTTYLSTISTNLGGQAVTTLRCDVYLNSKAVPSIGLGGAEHYLTECVDPRHSTCTAGENQQATGSGGCGGVYPPTGGSSIVSTSTVGSPASSTQTGSASRGGCSIAAARALSFLIIVWFGLL